LGQSTNVSANAAGGDGTYTYTWATGTLPVTGQTVGATPAATTTYTVVVNRRLCNTPAADSVVVVVNPLPAITIVVSQDSGCAPVCDTFSVYQIRQCKCSWTFTDGQTAAGSPALPPICFNAAGIYGATVHVTDVNGCRIH